MIGGRGGGISTRSSAAIIKIAVVGIAIGMAVMILSHSIVTGFQDEIQQKVIGFGSHLQVSLYNPQNTLGIKPIDRNQPFVSAIQAEPRVQNVNVFAHKNGIITANGEIKGVMVKGIDGDYDWSFFESYLQEGSVLPIGASAQRARTDSAMISRQIANQLELALGDKMTVVFIQDERERKRRFVIGGIYETGMEQFDNNVMLCDMQHIQKLNNWDGNQVAGFEVWLKDFDDLQHLDDIVERHVSWEFTTMKITDQFMEIFGWLELQNLNVIIILTLMILVSGINMITALLVFILDRTNMIGILKALGATNGSLSTLFLLNAGYLILIGTLWGNAIGLGLGWLQYHFEFIKLDQSNYYIDHVPVLFDWTTILLINLGSILLSLLMLVIPSRIVSRIDPVKTIRFN